MKIIRTTSMLALVSLLGACTPPTKSIQTFATGVTDTSTSVTDAFRAVAAVEAERRRIYEAAVYAVAAKTDPDGVVIVDFDRSPAGLPNEVVRPRLQVLALLQEYATLLTGLSGESVTAGFGAQIEGLGRDFSALQATAGEVDPKFAAFDPGPLLTAVDMFGRALIEAKATGTIATVAPRVHPHLERVVATLDSDMSLLANFGGNDRVDNAVSDVLVATPTTDPAASRYRLYREYADILAASSPLDTGTARTRRALAAMLVAHRQLANPKSPSAEVTVARFAALAHSAADFFDASFRWSASTP